MQHDTHPIAPSAPRRTLLRAGIVLALMPVIPAHAATPRVEVWKSPTCGCCGDWIDHLRAHGFEVTVHDTGNNAARRRFGLPDKLASCHTGLVGGYAVEGHVPAREIQRLLREKPRALGLAVPGMPIGSPGMDGPAYGNQRDRYDVLLVAVDGTTRPYQSYP
ncbi:MAG: DUF411 domain-containing protein [Burkholderiaceae bacterium]|nr:DUF411 domain-containing protein [Burkholderiaceae bacterium]